MDPLLNSLVVAGYYSGKPFLGTIGMVGTNYTDQHVATGGRLGTILFGVSVDFYSLAPVDFFSLVSKIFRFNRNWCFFSWNNLRYEEKLHCSSIW